MRYLPLTDAFIGVAHEHGRYLVETEGFPADKVRVIPNGVDVERFRPRPEITAAFRRELGIPASAPVGGVVAALRPEKNHELLLRVADIVGRRVDDAHFVVVGDGISIDRRHESENGRRSVVARIKKYLFLPRISRRPRSSD